MRFCVCSFLVFGVFLDDVLGLRLFAVVLHQHTATTDHVPGSSFAVSRTEARPFPSFLVVIRLNEVDLVLSTERLQQLDTHGFLTVVVNADVGLAAS